MSIYPLIIVLLNTLVTHTLLTRKRSFLYCITAFILNTIVVILAASLTFSYISNPLVSKYIMAFIFFLYITYNYFVFSESLLKKIFTMFSVWIISLIISFIAFCLTLLSPSTHDPNALLQLLYMYRLIIHLVIIVISKIWLSKPYKKSLNIVTNRTIVFMSIYLILAFLILIDKTFMTNVDVNHLDDFYETFMSILLVALGYIIVFAGIDSSAKSIMLQLHYKIVKNQVKLQHQNYKNLNDSLNQLYIHKHDTRHHISAIETLVRHQKYPEALEYINQFNKNEQSKTLPLLCENFVADSIIKYYMELAISKDIDLETNLIIPESIAINALDLCVVLGNCLENAIEASEKLKTDKIKRIQFTSKLVGTHILFYISNYYNGDLDKIGNAFKSSKDGRSHGIGLSSVFETVENYNGNVNIKYSENLFEITIIMCTSMV